MNRDIITLETGNFIVNVDLVIHSQTTTATQ